MSQARAHLLLLAGWWWWGVVVFLFAFVVSLGGDLLACPVPHGESDWGEPYWSFVPFGYGCDYTAAQSPPFGGREGPPLGYSVVALVLGALGLLPARAQRRYRRRFPDAPRFRDRFPATY